MAFDPKEYVSAEEKKQEFDPKAYLGSTESGFEAVEGQEIPLYQGPSEFGAIAPAVTGAAYARPTGINPAAVKQGLKPMIDIVPKTASQYMAPGGVLKGGLDLLGIGTVGVPPVASFEAMKGLAQTPEAISKTASEVGKITSQSAMTTSPVTGNQYPSSVPAYRDIQRAVGPEAAAKMSEAYAKGGNNAVLKYLDSAPEVKALMGSEDFAKLYETYKGAVPGKMAQVGKVVGPTLRGAARVAGPAGMAYELTEAYPTAVEAVQGDPNAMIRTGQTAGEMGLGYYAGKKLSEPGVIQQGMDYAKRIQQIAMDKVIQPAGQMARAAAPYAKGAVGLTAALMPGNVGQNYPFPTSGPMRGQEINPTTGRPWTPQELDAYRAQYGR